MALRNFNNKPTATQIAAANGTLTAGATTCVLNATANLPAAPFTATFERGSLTNEEVVLVTAVNTGTNTVTMTRGYDGTTGASHNAGASFEHTVASIDFTEANAHVNATTGVHGSTGALVDTGGAQAITGTKTFDAPVLVGAATGRDLTLQNTTVSTSGAQAQTPGGLRWAGHYWNAAGPADVPTTASIVPVVHAQVGGGIELVYTAATLFGHTFNGVINATGGIVIPRGFNINPDGGTANSAVLSESSAGTSFTGSTVSDLIIKEPNGQAVLIGTHGAAGVQNPSLRVSSADVEINDSGTMRSAPRGVVYVYRGTSVGTSTSTGPSPGTALWAANSATIWLPSAAGGAGTGNRVTLVNGRRYKFTLSAHASDSAVVQSFICANIHAGSVAAGIAPTSPTTLINLNIRAVTAAQYFAASETMEIAVAATTGDVVGGTYYVSITAYQNAAGTVSVFGQANGYGSSASIVIEDIGSCSAT